MPRATVSLEAETHGLKSCPPDGWVRLRRMSYGERLHRQDMAMALSMESDAKSKSTSLDIKQTQTQVAMYEMATTVVDHNLEDERGRRLDFRNQMDVKSLDPRVGEEIADLIEKMHDWEADLPNSEQRSTESSTASTPGTGTTAETATPSTSDSPQAK